MKLTTEQIRILQEGKIEENRFYLQSNLDRKKYLNINEVLETIGLKWVKGKKAHIIEGLNQEELENAINDIIETGEVETLKETIKKFQFYPTPKEVAEYLVELADIKEFDSILEPSAGLGNIADEIKTGKLTLVEFDFSKCEELLKKGYTPINSDFLTFNGNFDKIIMNPPYNKRQDYKHIKKAIELLKKGGRLVGLMSRGILFREDYKDLKEDIIEHGYIEELEAGAFKESGTMIGTCIIVYNK